MNRELERVLEAQKRESDRKGVERKLKTGEEKVKLKDVEIVWIFNAPVEAVWKAFTDPEIETQWSRCLTPVDSTGIEFLKHDLRVGGKYLLKSEHPELGIHYNTGTYTKIVPYRELWYTEAFADGNGKIISGREDGLNYDIPLERQVEVTFEEFQDGTRLRLVHRGLPDNGHSDIAATEIAKSLVVLAGMVEGS